MNEDFSYLKEKLSLPVKCRLPKDKTKSNKLPDYFDKRLDEKAIQNLHKWYKEDYRFLKILEDNNLIHNQDT